MKKYLNSLLFMAVALFSATVMVSCGSDDDDDPEPDPIPTAQNYAKYTAKFSEDVFEYFDVSLTIEVDGKKEVYTFGEDTKVEDINFEMMNILDKDASKAGRVLVIPAFKFDVHPIRFNTEIKLTEAGKQKIANATEGDKMNFYMELEFGECNENGVFHYDPSYRVYDFITGGGAYVKTLDAFLNNINQTHKKNFDKTFK